MKIQKISPKITATIEDEVRMEDAVNIKIYNQVSGIKVNGRNKLHHTHRAFRLQIINLTAARIAEGVNIKKVKDHIAGKAVEPRAITCLTKIITKRLAVTKVG